MGRWRSRASQGGSESGRGSNLSREGISYGAVSEFGRDWIRGEGKRAREWVREASELGRE